MDPLIIQGQLRSLQTMAPGQISPELRLAGPKTEPTSGGKSFGELLGESIKDVNATQFASDASVQKLVTGQGGSVHETLLSVQQAEMSMRMLVELRSKAIQAYQEIMRMQV